MSEIVPAKTLGQTQAIANLAQLCQVQPDEAVKALVDTIMPGAPAPQVVAFAMVCSEMRLNPFKGEIFAIKNKAGIYKPLVGVDGWVTSLNRHPQYDGCEFVTSDNDKTGKPFACTVRIYRKDRTRPTEVTEYFDECRQSKDTWDKSPRRMLRHRTLSQGARLAMGFVGVADEDESDMERLPSVPMTKTVREAGSTASVNDRLKSLPEPSPATPPQGRDSAAAPEPDHATDGVIEAEATVVEEREPEPVEPERTLFRWEDKSAPANEARQDTTAKLLRVERKPGRGSPYLAVVVEDFAGELRLLMKDVSVQAPLEALVGSTVDVRFDPDAKGNRLVSIAQA